MIKPENHSTGSPKQSISSEPHGEQAPDCEIITIGSELLLGQIVDTNTAYVAQKMATAGVSVQFKTSVGDRVKEISDVIQSAVKRCRLVITTGGLGPTLDDLTRDAVARTAGVSLVFKKDLMQQIEEIFRRYGYGMPENNRRQAFIPEGGVAIPNPVGTAPAFIKEIDGRPVICLPGVPRELKYLLKHSVIPWIRERFKIENDTVIYRVLKVAGIGESAVDKVIGDLIRPGENPEVGLLASQGEIKIRIAAKARTEGEALSLINPVSSELHRRLGKKIFGSDKETLEGKIDSILEANGLSLAILETFSGGMAAHKLHAIPSRQLLASRVIPGIAEFAEFLGRKDTDVCAENCLSAARKTAHAHSADVGLALMGFLENTDKGYLLKGCAAAWGTNIEKSFSWEMGGDLFALQTRGAVIGLNTLRLALV